MTWIKALAVCGLLVLAVAIIFGQTVGHEFIDCDDDPYVYGNPPVTAGLTPDSVWWAMTAYHAGNWHPLTWMSHMLDVDMYGIHYERPQDAKNPKEYKGPQPWKGPEAGRHHLTSVALHAAGAVVLFLALWQMTGEFWLSALVAAMFAVHPLRVESVAWAAERKDVLSGLFWMLTLLAYGWYVRRPGVGRYLAVSLCLALGLSAKSMLVSLPCVLLLLDFWPLRRRRQAAMLAAAVPRPMVAALQFPAATRIGGLVVEKLPLFAMSAAVCIIISSASTGPGR